jgi:type I restriction enzyme R subunit
MAIDTKERTFEQEIEYWLTNGAKKTDRYVKGSPSAFSRELAMDTGAVIAFVKNSQPKAWVDLEKRHGADVEREFLKRLCAELDKRGMIDVLRHGIVDLGVPIRLAYFKPGSGMNKSLSDLYDKNVLQITRHSCISLWIPRKSG